MSNLQYVDDIVLRNCEIVSAKPAEKKSDKSPDLIELFLKRRKWMPKKNKFAAISSVEDMELWVKLKIPKETFEILKSLGLKKNSLCDFELANNGWATDKDSGTWYQFLGLLKIDGRDINHFIYQQSNNTSNSNDWESNEEIGEVA